MAGAKLKQGLDYFPMSTRRDSRFKIIKALHGWEGYAILNTLLQDIHGEKGYYVRWNERLAKIFASENGFNYEKTVQTVCDSLAEGIFNEEQFITNQILTSEDIQQVWINVAKERKEIIHIPAYLLIDITPYLKSLPSINNVEQENTEDAISLLEISDSIEKENYPIVNSNNLNFNSINPTQNNTSKGSKETEGNKEEKVEEFNQRKKSEASILNFSHPAENSSPLKNEESEKKIKLQGENFIILTNEELPENTGKSEPSNGMEKENSGGNNQNNNAGKLGNLFTESFDKENIRSGISENKTDDFAGKQNFKKNEKQKSSNKPVHPARAEIIQAWEDKFGQPYENSLTGNSAIKKIIRHLDKLSRKVKGGDILEEEEINKRIIELWKVILSNWEKLDKFYRNLIRFESIAEYLTEIINQLKEYGRAINPPKQQTNTSGSKPSFDRFRR